MSNRVQRVGVSEEEKESLTLLFIMTKVETLSKAEINIVVTNILKLSSFKHLNKGHISRVVASFKDIHEMRKKVGSKLLAQTEKLAKLKEESECQTMTTLLSQLYLKFFMGVGYLKDGRQQEINTLPGCYKQLLRACNLCVTSDVALGKDDMEKVLSFEIFYKDCLLAKYCEIWDRLSSIELGVLYYKFRGASVPFGSSAMNLELESFLEMCELCSNENSDLFKAFYSGTYALVVNNIQYDKLYDFGGSMNLYPEFAQEASVGNLLSLKTLFLLDFEDLCYDRYIRELQVFQLEEFSADLVGTEVTEEGEGQDETAEDSKDGTASIKGIRDNMSHKAIVYYIAGYCIRTAIGVLPVEELGREVLGHIVESLQSEFFFTLDEATQADLPIDVVVRNASTEASLAKFVFISKSFFDTLVSLEEDVIEKYMTQSLFVVVLGKDIIHFIKTKTLSHSALTFMLSKVKQCLEVVRTGKHTTWAATDDDIEKYSKLLVSKFFDVYIKVATNDFVFAAIKRMWKNKKSLLSNISFRVAVQLDALNLGDSPMIVTSTDIEEGGDTEA